MKNQLFFTNKVLSFMVYMIIGTIGFTKAEVSALGDVWSVSLDQVEEIFSSNLRPGYENQIAVVDNLNTAPQYDHDNYLRTAATAPSSLQQIADDLDNGTANTYLYVDEFIRDMKVALAPKYGDLTKDEIIMFIRSAKWELLPVQKGDLNGMMVYKEDKNDPLYHTFDPQEYKGNGEAWFAVYSDPDHGKVRLFKGGAEGKTGCFNPQPADGETPASTPCEINTIYVSVIDTEYIYVVDTVYRETKNVYVTNNYITPQQPVYQSTGEFYVSAGVSASIGYYPPPQPMYLPPLLPPAPQCVCCQGGNTTIIINNDNDVTNIIYPTVVDEGPVPTPSHDDEGPVPTPSHADVVGPVPTPSHGEGLATTDGTEGPAQTDSENEGGKSSGSGTEAGELTAAEQAAFVTNTPINVKPKTFATQVSQEQTINGVASNSGQQNAFVGNEKNPKGVSNNALALNTNQAGNVSEIKNITPSKPTVQNTISSANTLLPVKDHVSSIGNLQENNIPVKTNLTPQVSKPVKTHTADQQNASKIPVRNIQQTPNTSLMSTAQNSGRPNVQNGAIAANTASVRSNYSNISNGVKSNTRPTTQQYSGGLSLQNRPGQQSGLQNLQTASAGNRPTQFSRPTQQASRPQSMVQQGPRTMPNRAVAATSVSSRPGTSAMRAPAMMRSR